jgi:tetratricopeptide (TPR) repeat protein
VSLLLSESNRLIAPADWLPLEPPSLREPTEAARVMLPPANAEPGFLVRARALRSFAPDSAVAFARLAQAELAAAHKDDALAAAREAIRLARKTDDVSPALAAVQVLISGGAYAEAEERLSGLPSSPARSALGARLALRRNDPERALMLLREVDTAESIATQAWIAIQRREFQVAITLLRRALKKTGPNSNLLVNLGYAYAALGLLDKAIATTRQAHHLDPTSRFVALNLVAFYRSVGDIESANSELKALRGLYPNDLNLVFAEADLRLWNREVDGALRVLTQARTSLLWVNAELTERAELESNLVFVRWLLGRVKKHDAFEELVTQLKRTEFQSLAVANMIPMIADGSEQAPVLSEILDTLREGHPGASFDRFEVQICLLSLNFEEATERAVAWATKDIFNSTAAGLAVYLLADVQGDYDRAISIGRDALRRNPSADQLVNNVAYALALDGQTAQALRLLPERTDDVFLTATRALVAVMLGDIASGRAGYERAVKLAEQTSREELPALVRYHELVFTARALRQQHAGEGSEVVLRLPEDWQGSPQLALVARIAEREGVPVVSDAEPLS